MHNIFFKEFFQNFTIKLQLLWSEMCNRRRFLIDYVIDYLFFWHIRNRIRHFFQKSNRNRIRIRQKKI